MLSKIPTKEEWMELFELSKKHALVGITFAAVVNLKEITQEGQILMCKNLSEITFLQWLGLAAKIGKRNEIVDKACVKVSEEFIAAGFEPVILKGQGNNWCYPEHLKNCRTPGDIDVWVSTDRSKVIDYVRPKVAHLEARIHHVEYNDTDGIPVEVHYWPMLMYSFRTQRRIEAYFENWRHDQWMNKVNIGGGTVAIPTPSFNAVFQMVHIMRHLFEDGIGLRQLLDYHLVLRSLHIEQCKLADSHSLSMGDDGMGGYPISNEEIMRELSVLGMDKFASGLMWVLDEVFGTPKEYMLCMPDERRGRILLEDIMRGGNFGFYDKTKPEYRNRGRVGMFVYKMHRNLKVWALCPREVVAAPFFRIWHFLWRHLHGYVPPN